MTHINARRRFATTDQDYGPKASNLIVDMEEDVFLKKRQEFLQQLQHVDKKDIFNNTILQSNCDTWKRERQKRITASNFGKICKLRKTTSTAKTVSSLLYSSFMGSQATTFGLEKESIAIALFEKKTGKTVNKSGLVIDDNLPYLACSPDGLIDNHAIIEIKSSLKSGNLSPVDAVLQKKIDYCFFDNGNVVLKRNHNYFFQIQGLLHITKRDVCYFVIYTNGGLHVEEIVRDDTFWIRKMEKRLVDFYLNSLLPELVDPRRSRQQDIRNVYLT
ncbi:hypothetical protein RN001_005053 [Aquatica leii]|uniref:YqaJ viral recombinase domain-containing protein n=1 Tax=Aquatica leii TaxID=1421715 RepID=A0AAN7PZG1_9COLE|nr:hypothetical protein RN001_005053 [Aquatica leii]